MAALMTKEIQARQPGIELTILSQSSIEILRHLEDFSIDVGLTYLDNEPIEGMRAKRSTWSGIACSCAPTMSWRRRLR